MPSRRERFERISSAVAEETNEALAVEISSLTFLTEDDVERVLPRKIDKDHFAQLMAIVASSTSQNNKVAALKENLDDVGGVLVKVLKLFL